VNELELSMKKIEHELVSLAKDKVAAVNTVGVLEKAYDWISEEKQ
jgi:structural maintenance of chromosome 2